MAKERKMTKGRKRQLLRQDIVYSAQMKFGDAIARVVFVEHEMLYCETLTLLEHHILYAYEAILLGRFTGVIIVSKKPIVRAYK